ncbi:NAD-dependent protein deacetylase hst4 [Smittium culicis]|uniref:NAD-dependent protein deacetylase hst4 n=1 Tax=Smittium culicis TaxID=133412 RepID=A0A1R1XZV8_9FUNG|nr:NAD-dependent protein deacetylase hst4 [Smittium culicis]OMJ22626.1 NAD-dependent protein deacetylase hst4 [Smittium culicis]
MGETLPCPKCSNNDLQRSFRGKRPLGVGLLRPDVVLYNEQHPQAEVIGLFSEFDLRRKPDLLIVIGTSLKIPGVKRLAKEISKTVESSSEFSHKNGTAKSIYINCGPPNSFKEWESVFDFFVDGPSDVAVEMLKCSISLDSLPLSVFVSPSNSKMPLKLSKSAEKKRKNLEKLLADCEELSKESEESNTENSTNSDSGDNMTMVSRLPGDDNENVAKAYADFEGDEMFVSRSLKFADTCYGNLFSDSGTLTDICSSDIEGLEST